MKIPISKQSLSLFSFLARHVWICVLPMVLLAICLAITYVIAMQSHFDKQASNLAHNVATAIDRQIGAQIGALTVLGKSPLADDPQRWSEFYREANGFRESFGGHVILADLSLQMRFNTRVPFNEKLPHLPTPKGHVAVQEVLKTGAPSVGDMFIGPIAKEPLVAAVVPILRDGQIRFLLLSTIETRQYQDYFDKLEIPNGWGLVLLDGKDDSIAFRLPRQENGKLVDQSDAVRFTAPSSLSHWKVVLYIPKTIHRAPAITAAAILAVIICIATLITVLSGRWTARRLAGSVKALAEMAPTPVGYPNLIEIEAARAVLIEAGQAKDAAEWNRRQAEVTLREQGLLVREIEKIAKIGGWELDPYTMQGSWTEEAALIHDLDPTQTIGEHRLGYYQGESRKKIENALGEAVELGKAFDLELELVTAKGVHKWVRSIGKPVFEHGKVVRLQGSLQDISAAKQTEEQLRQAHARLRRFVDANVVGVVIATPSGKVIETNDYYLRTIGYTREEFEQGMVDWRVITPPEWIPADDLAIRELRERGTCTPYEKEYVRRDGTRVSVFLSDAMIPGPEEQIAAFMLDITERKKAERDLTESEALFRNLFEHHAAVKLIIDPDTGAIIDANRAAANFYGWSQDQLRQMSIQQINTLSEQQIKNEIERVRTQKRNQFEFRHRRADGSIRDVEVFSSKIVTKGKDILHSIVHDITERKKAERALRESEANLRKSQQTAKLGSWTYGLDGQLSWTEELYRICGVSPQTFKVTAPAFMNLIQAGDRKAMQAWIDDCISGKRPGELEFRVVLPDGTLRYLSGRGDLICDEEGKPTHMAGTAQDITERKQAELALRQSENKFRMIVENSRDIIYTLSATGEYIFVSPAIRFLLGYDEAELVGRPFQSIIHPDDAPKCEETIRRNVEQGIRTPGFEYRVRHAGGEWRWHTSSGGAVYDAHGDLLHFQGVSRDITEQRRLEDQFRQAQKMESVGRLAGGVAHDFNNMLSVILGNAELAIGHVSPTEAAHDELNQIVVAAQRSADITRQLLAFARKQTIAPEVLDLNATVESMLRMLRRLIGENVELAWLPGAALGLIKMDPSQLDQILANLCVNARDAIADVGKITIETDNVQLDDGYCADRPGFVPGQYVLLTLSDNGCGMGKEVLEHLFEPFFTTKDIGKGTGLGLATVYGIVKQNNGFINVYSEPGKGTTFKIYLPRHLDQPAEVIQEKKPALPLAHGETILLVEDELSILLLIKKILESVGYQVLAAQNPKEAIKLAEQHTDKIHLLITDVVMPEMNGRDLAQRLLMQYPDLKCLYISGYTADVIAHSGVLDQGVQFLSKPFTRQTLATKVRTALEG